MIQCGHRLKVIPQAMVALIIFTPLLYTLHVLDRKAQLPPIEVDMQQSAVNIDRNILTLFAMGNKRLLSSILWVHTLMESDLEHYKKRDLNSWMYLRFDAITDLSPRFYEAYLYGGEYLSVVKDDTWGAKKIYEKGLMQYPDDFYLNFYAGFHYYYELGDPKEALVRYNRIVNDPLVPKVASWLPSLVARFNAAHGSLETSLQIIRTAWEQAPEDSPLKTRFDQSMYAIKAEMDLNCLNQKKDARCSRTDHHNQPYLMDEGGRYHAREEWLPFRPYEKK